MLGFLCARNTTKLYHCKYFVRKYIWRVKCRKRRKKTVLFENCFRIFLGRLRGRRMQILEWVLKCRDFLFGSIWKSSKRKSWRFSWKFAQIEFANYLKVIEHLQSAVSFLVITGDKIQYSLLHSLNWDRILVLNKSISFTLFLINSLCRGMRDHYWK